VTPTKLQGYKAQLGYAAANVAITAATNANPTVLTIAGVGTGMTAGTLILLVITGFTGSWAPLNGVQVTATIATANTCSVAVNATAFGAITGTPFAAVMTTVAGLKELDGAFKAEELDATDHGGGGWKSRMPGLLDFESTAKLDYIAGDATQEYLLGTALTITLFPQQVDTSGCDSYIGSVIMTDFKWDGKNNDLQGVSISLKGAGAFTVVTQ
jgi:predicted secreted protein